MAAIKNDHSQLFRIELMPFQLTPQLQLFQQHDISSVLQPIPSPTTSTGATCLYSTRQKMKNFNKL